MPSHGFNPRSLTAPPSPRDLGKFKSARVNQERLKFFRELCNIPGCPQAFNLSSAHHRLRDVSHQELLLEIHKNICDKKRSFVLCLFIFRGFGGGFRKLKLTQLACFSEGGEGKKYAAFAHVWRNHAIISYRNAWFLEDDLKIWHKVQG